MIVTTILALAAYSAVGLLIGEVERLRTELSRQPEQVFVMVERPATREIDEFESPGHFPAGPWVLPGSINRR